MYLTCLAELSAIIEDKKFPFPSHKTHVLTPRESYETLLKIGIDFGKSGPSYEGLITVFTEVYITLNGHNLYFPSVLLSL